MNVRFGGALSLSSLIVVLALNHSAIGNEISPSLHQVGSPEQQFQAPAQQILPVRFLSCSDDCQDNCGAGDCAADQCGTNPCGASGCGCGDACGCAESCGTGCGCGMASGCGDIMGVGCLTGLLAERDRCWDDFVSPMTNPVYFEDPRTLSEARFLFVTHKLPGRLGGESVQLYALQLRAALTDRLSIIATKDGYLVSSNPVVDDGWADVAAGLKYNLIKDYENRFLLSAGFTYELPVGETRALQGNGDGLWDLFLTTGLDLGHGFHFMSASGFLLPSNRNQESSLWYLSTHLDQHIGKGFYWLGELNLFHWMGSGQNGVPGVEGLDVFNLGSTGVAGNDIVTAAIGMKYKPTAAQEIGVAFEFPLTHRRDILDNRLTVDYRIRY